MRIRCLEADPAGNITGFVLSPVPLEIRPAAARALMRQSGGRIEQVAFADESRLTDELPSMEMMGGEFCGNAARSFALLCARAGKQTSPCERRIRVSGASAPVTVHVDPSAGLAFADMPLPRAATSVRTEYGSVSVVCMEGICHAVVFGAPGCLSPEDLFARMPQSDAMGILFIEGDTLTPLVFVPRAGTCVWESSCGSGSVAYSWLMSLDRPDGEYLYTLNEPGGILTTRITVANGRPVRAVMGGPVSLGPCTEITLSSDEE